MMRSTCVWLAIALFMLPSAGAWAQVRIGGAALYESYGFDGDFALGGGPEISAVSQLSVPFTVAYPLGTRVNLTASGGLVRVEMTPVVGSDRIEPVTGATDTEFRLEFQLVPDRLFFVATGSAATGQRDLAAERAAVLALLVRDVLGFSTRSLGSGGHLGAGLAGAVQAGDMALGFAGTYTQFGSYEAVAGTNRQLAPAAELRLRGGVEGPVGNRGYVRVAGIFAHRGADRINGAPVLESSSRFATYASYDGRVGTGSFLAYAYDLYRGGAQLEGAALLPRSNLIAIGLQLTFPITRETRLIPRVELRRKDQATADRDQLDKLGTSFRLGAELRQPLSGGATLVLEANGLLGDIVQDMDATAAETVGVSGYRFGLHLEVVR